MAPAPTRQCPRMTTMFISLSRPVSERAGNHTRSVVCALSLDGGRGSTLEIDVRQRTRHKLRVGFVRLRFKNYKCERYKGRSMCSNHGSGPLGERKSLLFCAGHKSDDDDYDGRGRRRPGPESRCPKTPIHVASFIRSSEHVLPLLRQPPQSQS